MRTFFSCNDLFFKALVAFLTTTTRMRVLDGIGRRKDSVRIVVIIVILIQLLYIYLYI